MANPSLIMRRNIQVTISRCVNSFVDVPLPSFPSSTWSKIPKHSKIGYLFQNLRQHEILDKRNSRFDLYYIVKNLFLSFFFPGWMAMALQLLRWSFSRSAI